MLSALIYLVIRFSNSYFKNFSVWLNNILDLYAHNVNWLFMGRNENAFSKVLPFISFNAFISLTQKIITFSIISILSILFLSLVRNIIDAFCKSHINKLPQLDNDKYKLYNNFMKPINVIYSILSYISIFISWVAVSMLSVIAITQCLSFADKEKTYTKLYFLVFIIYIIFSIVLLIIDIKKDPMKSIHLISI